MELKFMDNNVTEEGKHDNVKKGLQSSGMNVSSADKRKKYSERLAENQVNCLQ